MMNFYSVLLFFFIFGLFKVNSCDCFNGNKSSGSDSSAAKSGSPLIDISGKKVEELESLSIIGVKLGVQVDSTDVRAFKYFIEDEHVQPEILLTLSFIDKKIRVFYKKVEGGGDDVIIFVSSDIVSQLGLDTNKSELHKLNNQIYYFYYLFSKEYKLCLDNKDNVFANLDISKLKWND